MGRFLRVNNWIGWFVFFIAGMVYAFTVEPSVSFWDCGELITVSGKLEVGHPPGAPVFMLVARVFSLFAVDKAHIAICVNFVSVVSSALTVMFLFWTLVRLGLRIGKEENQRQLTLLWISAATAALAFAFTDSFWFSAVEAEVYASSMLFTAMVFWAVLKWDDCYREAYASRWLLLIAFLTGLSTGIHILNLLSIPAVIWMVFFKHKPVTLKNSIFAVLVGIAALAVVQFVLISGLLRLLVLFELFAVNQLELPFNSGVISAVVLLILSLFLGIWYSRRWKKKELHTALLVCALFLVGFSSYTMLLIRSSANPPMNEGQPDSVFALQSYLHRDQYGKPPLFYGPYYNAPIVKTIQGEPVYIRNNDRYDISYCHPKYQYDSRFCTFFPRMYSSDSNDADFYKNWGSVKGKPIEVKDLAGIHTEQCPTFTENLTFFFNYQVYYMYWRYFLWNFVGRQNDLDGNGGIMRGNFVTGFSFLDKIRVGDHYPEYLKKNKSHNRYFAIPLLVGLIGFFFQAFVQRKEFLAVSILFVMTGLAIVVYLNQTPFQPRERDYAYVGSFYGFSIWIGLGVFFVLTWADKIHSKLPVALHLPVALSLPAWLLWQNHDDHNRSNRYTTRDLAWNYLQSCEQNAILFTEGDNDTFPLWYLQEIEGIRTDVRIVNLSLLSSDWYIRQMKRKVNESDLLPISLSDSLFQEGKLNYVYLSDRNPVGMSVQEGISKATSPFLSDKLEIDSAEYIDYIQTRNFSLAVDSALILKKGLASTKDSLGPFIRFRIGRSYLSKSSLIVLDIIANNHWQRPIYFTSPPGSALGLDNYLRLEGFAWQLTPVLANVGENVQTDSMYHRLMSCFRWGNMNQPKILIDNINQRTMSVVRFRQNTAYLAKALYLKGKKDSAQNSIKKSREVMPEGVFFYDRFSLELIKAAMDVLAFEQALQMIEGYSKQCEQTLFYIQQMPNRLSRLMLYEKHTNERALEELTALKNQVVRLKHGVEK